MKITIDKLESGFLVVQEQTGLNTRAAFPEDNGGDVARFVLRALGLADRHDAIDIIVRTPRDDDWSPEKTKVL